MIPIPRQLFILQDRLDFRRLVEAGAPPHLRVVEAPDAAALLELLHHAAPLPLVLLDGSSLAGERAELPDLRRVMDGTFYTGLVAVMDRVRGADRVLRVGGGGAAEVLCLESEATPAALRVRLESATVQACTRLARRFFGAPGNARGHLILPAAVETVVEGGDSRDLALRLGIERRTLSIYCSRAHLPAPRRLLAWTRLLLACSLLDEPHRQVGEIARLCGYSNANALRTAFAQFLGRPPRQLRREGAFAIAQQAYRSDRRAFRKPTQRPEV